MTQFKAMLSPPKRTFRPAPPDSPSTSLVGLERVIPPGQPLPRLPGRSSNFDKPLPKLPQEPSSKEECCRSNSGKRVDSYTCQSGDQRSSREMSQHERDEYDEWWNQQNRKPSEAPPSSQATIQEGKSPCVSLREFLLEPSEADLYMGNTPVKANPYAQEKKRATPYLEPKSLPEFQAVAKNNLKGSKVTGSGFIVSSDMSQRSLVPAPLNLSQEQVIPVDSLSRFSSSDSGIDVPMSPSSICNSVRSYMRKKMSLRKSSGRKKGKQPATSLSSVESACFPEGRIPPHYTGEYDIQPKVSRASIQRGVADLEKRMRATSVSCGSDMSYDRELGWDRSSSEYGCRYGYQSGEESRGSEDYRSSGSRRRGGQQLAVPTSPYKKYGPKIWDPPGIEKLKPKESTGEKKKSKGEGDGTKSSRETMKSRIIGHAFRSRGRKKSDTAPPESQEGGVVGARSPSLQQFDYCNRSQSHYRDQGRSRSRSQLTDLSEYMGAFYRGSDQVVTAYEMAKNKLGMARAEERRRLELKRSIVVLKPADLSVERSRSDQWV